MKVLLIGHQGFGNRGCEAIVRSTAAMLLARHPDLELLVPSARPASDAAQWPAHRAYGVRFISAPPMPWRLHQWGRVTRRIPALAGWRWPLPPLDDGHRLAMERAQGVLSIGGDNLTLDYGLPSLALHAGLAEVARRRGIPVVLWGASVGPFQAWPAVAQRMQRHLQALSAITVRESITAQWLEGLHPQPMLVHTRDPAFTLKPQTVDLAPHWPTDAALEFEEGESRAAAERPEAGGADAHRRPVMGLNLSPLAPPGAQQAVADFAVAVICRGHAVALVPHVTAQDADGRPAQAIASHQDDGPVLNRIRQHVQLTLGPQAPISVLPGWNAAQLKHAIAQCHTFVGARTHSVIAALSSRVPALALAYSPKARGIHRDLLGHEDGVVALKDLDAATLLQAWQALLARHAVERSHLQTRIPMWQQQAMAAVSVMDGWAT